MDKKTIRFAFVCETCGESAILTQTAGGGEWEGMPIIHIEHVGCNLPTLTMMTDNPRKLGIITGESAGPDVAEESQAEKGA